MTSLSDGIARTAQRPPQRIPAWRMRGRPFDPQQRARSRGEAQVVAVEALCMSVIGVFVAALVLAAIWRAVIG